LAKADEQVLVTKISPKSGEVLCKHKDKAEHFAHGLCEKCYNKVTDLYHVHNTSVLGLHYS
jgi:transcription factor IIIB subunit 2